MEKDLDKQYDLKVSLKEVEVLYSAIADAEGRIIDGMHRLAADSRCPFTSFQTFVHTFYDKRPSLW